MEDSRSLRSLPYPPPLSGIKSFLVDHPSWMLHRSSTPDASNELFSLTSCAGLQCRHHSVSRILSFQRIVSCFETSSWPPTFPRLGLDG